MIRAMQTKAPPDWLTAAVYRPLRWLLGSVFLYSGASKLISPLSFAILIDAYGLVPEMLLMPAALLLAALEVIAGIGLITDIRGSLAVITGLLLLFVAILGYGILMGLDVDCGCFGPDDPEADAFHDLRPALYRDLAMLAAVAWLYGWRHHAQIRPINLGQLRERFPGGAAGNIVDDH
jgi:hypothetical protein